MKIGKKGEGIKCYKYRFTEENFPELKRYQSSD